MVGETDVDVVIIGAGGGGYPAAFRLARAGRRVVMADPFGNLGGNCLAEGCVPSKAVREAGLARAGALKHPLFGLSGAPPAVDWQGVLRHKDRVQAIRYAQHREEIAAAPGLLMREGRGRLLDEHRVEIVTATGETGRWRAQHILIATGARPRLPPIPGAELALTSHDLFRLGADLPQPRRLVVIGGGYIGLETASMLQNLGTQAAVIELAPEILPGVDPELGGFLRKALARRIDFHLRARVTAIRREEGGGLRVHFEREGKTESVSGDAVLMAVGREPVLPEGAEALGFTPGRPVAVDGRLRTAIPHIYAPGDVNGRSMLFHSAVTQSLIAAEDILSEGRGELRMNFGAVPFTVFTEPEIAWVGVGEAEAKARGLEVVSAVYDYRTDSRAQIFDEMEGFIKLVFDRRTRTLCGAQVAGLDAAQVIAPLALAVHSGTPVEALRYTSFPHPMISEGINKAARAARL